MVMNTSLPAALAVVPPASDALPSGGSVPTGFGSVGEFDYNITGELHVRDVAEKTVINWGNFDIGSAALTRFHQLGVDPAVLNRITSGEATGIFGSLQANGRVFIVNPAGIVFGANSTVNVTQLVASTLNITNENFWNGKYEFAGDIEGVDVQERLGVINNSDVLHGIHAAEGVALIGKKILNAGTITTNEGGIVVMAAGDRVLLGNPGSKVVVEMDSVTLSGSDNPEGFGNVVNEGAITAPGGTVVLAAGDIFSVPLHPQLKVNSGTVEAPVYDVADQPVRVESGIGTVTQSGTIKADGGSVILTAGNTTAEDGDIPDVVLSAGSLTQAVGGEVITYAHDFGTKGTTTGATTSFENGAVINVGTGTAEISGNHILFAGSVNALPGGTIQVDPVTLTIADTMPVTGPELDTLYEEQHVEFYSQAGVNLDLAADKMITVEYMANSGAVGEITGGSGDIYLRNVFGEGGIYFEQADEAGHTGPRSSIRTEAYYQSATVYRDGGSIYMDAGSGGIVAGDLKTGTKSNDKMSQPGEIVLRTANGGDIEVGTMRAEGASSTQVSAISDGDLIVNGDVRSINKQTDNTQQSVFSATMCLLAEGDIHLNGSNYEVYAQGKGELVSDIRISAGENVYIGSAQAPATIKAESKVAQSGIATKSTAYIVIHAGRNLPGPGVININGRSYTPGAAYSTGGVFTAVALNGGVNASSSPSSSDGTKTVWENVGNPAANFFAKIEINSNETVPLNEGPCKDCPKPPGLPPIPHIFIIANDSFPVSWSAEDASLDVLANDYADELGNPIRLILGDIADPQPITTDLGGTLTVTVLTDEFGDPVLDELGNPIVGFEYTPPSGVDFVWDGESEYASFTDTFSYKAEDSLGNESVNSASVTITVTNYLPVLSGDSDTIHMSTTSNPTGTSFDLDGLITDADGSPQPLIKGYDDSATMGGTVSLPDSTATYEPYNGFVTEQDTPDTFQYTVQDNRIVDENGDPVVLSETIEVTVDNTLPTVGGDLGTEHMNTEVSDLDFMDYAEDADNDPVVLDTLEIISVSQGVNGGTLTQDNGTWTYTPPEGYVGDDSFEVELWDGQNEYVDGELVGPVTVTGTMTITMQNKLPGGDGWIGMVKNNSTNNTQNNLADGFDFIDADMAGDVFLDTHQLIPGTYTGNHGGTLTIGYNEGTDEWTYVYSPFKGYEGDNVDNWFGTTYTKGSNSDEAFVIPVWDGQMDYSVEGNPAPVYGEGMLYADIENSPTPPAPVVYSVAVPYIQPAPGLQKEVIEVSGCPALVQWVASELGTDESQIQIWMANSLASGPGIQPCDACANLKEAATILQDADGTRMAALTQVVSQFASSTAPPTEEQMASIADAIANDIQGNRQYAEAGEYLDALAKYVGILTSEMGLTADESIQFATDNYVGQLAEGENVGVAAYVAARLAALGGSQ
ncbi:MAG: hypothetical protein A2168_07300 [Planctomycetes bacterium RBG_13_50_24]|nr:MAG: hypothetical protein A2168_07300 [Planctomycetes bacterium RBG_13_50_24]